jgi:hypothetical protein
MVKDYTWDVGRGFYMFVAINEKTDKQRAKKESFITFL